MPFSADAKVKKNLLLPNDDYKAEMPKIKYKAVKVLQEVKGRGKDFSLLLSPLPLSFLLSVIVQE